MGFERTGFWDGGLVPRSDAELLDGGGFFGLCVSGEVYGEADDVARAKGRERGGEGDGVGFVVSLSVA